MNIKHSFLPLLLMLGLSLPSIISCSDDNDDNGGSASNQENKNSNSWYGSADAMRLEIPALTRNVKGTYFLRHQANISNSSTTKTMDFCLEYDSASSHSRWVAFVFDNTTREKRTSRQDTWGPDPLLPASCRLNPNAYSGSGYTRGHICASADRLFSTEANQKTFYMSNMSPQSYLFNTGYWVSLEGLIQDWGRSNKYKTLYVVKGGTIASKQIKGSFTTKNAQGNTVRVAIPRYYFAAVLAETSTSSFQAAAFFVEHKEYSQYSYDDIAPRSEFKSKAMTVDQLESLTGIDFFCNLNDVVEDAVEKAYSEAAWTW